MKRVANLLPGVALCLAITGAAILLARAEAKFGGAVWLEPLVLAILLGTLLRTMWEPGARWREDEPLIETVVHLTEWPSALLGNFEPEYLALPEEVLVTVMRDHQKYFAVEGPDGKLLPHFLTVLNIEVDEEGKATIQHGNQKVLRARFKDARFFWEVDQHKKLADRLDDLANVTFQAKLGSYLEKTKRVAELANELGGAAD